jgi:hypothetical protein
MQMALEALEAQFYTDGRTIKALRDRLAQPEPEPVAYRNKETGEFCTGGFLRGQWDKWRPLYTAPPKREWVGLTHDEATHLVERFGSDPLYLLYQNEVKLKEKNSG